MEQYVGSKVAKVFPGYNNNQPYEGKVKGIADVRGNKYFRIRYGDGDEEDITLTALLKILVDGGRRAEKRKKGVQAVTGGKKNKGPHPLSSKSMKKTSDAVKSRPTAAAAAPKSKQRKRWHPIRNKVAAGPAEAQEEEEIDIEKFIEGEEGEKSVPPTAVAVGSARAHISSFLTAGKKMLLGEGERRQQQEQEEEAGPTNLLQELLTQNEGEADVEEQKGKEEEEDGINEDIAPHEFLHPSGTGKEAPPASAPITITNMKQGRRVSNAPAPEKEQQQGSIQRFEYSGPRPADGISASAAVAVNGFVFIGALTRPGIISYDQQENTPPELYSSQIVEIFRDLDEILKKTGNIGKGDLVSVDVQFKDSAVGYEPFIEEWNTWLGDSPAPATKMGESFMGGQCTLVSLSAVARLPAGQ
ncbi:hypothetical protein Ndes2526B_g06896 [Nannochloris sp. 'desiccata']